MRKLTIYLVFLIGIFLAGCTASMVVGDAIRSGQKDISVATPSNASLSSLKQDANIAISLDGITENGQSIYAMGGGGSANPKVYSDMLQSELIQEGYSARSLDQKISENSSKTKLDSLSKNGINAILSGNLSLGSTTSMSSAAFGGDYMDRGITSFTVKGIDVKDGSILFIISGEYGKAKEPSVIAEDISSVYKDILAGNTEKYSEN